MGLFKRKKGKFGIKKKSDVDSRIIKRGIILKNQNNDIFFRMTDFSAVLNKCQKDLEDLKVQIIDFSKELELN